MRRSEEIQKLINRVVLNEQVRLVKQNLPKEELKKNQAYLENTILYEAIKDAFENDTEDKQRIEVQVEKNKAILEEELEPTLEVKEDNILMLRALKLMHTKEMKKEGTKEYRELCYSLVKLDHLLYVDEVQNFIEEFCGGKVSGEDEIRDKNPQIYDSINVMRKSGHKLILQDEIMKRTTLYLNELEMELLRLGDSENYDVLHKMRISKETNSLSDYKGIISELKMRYEPKNEKCTDFDEYIIQYSEELKGANYGENAISYEGQITAITAMTVRKQSLFEKFTNRVKSIFSRKPKKTVEPATIEAQKDESGLTVKARRNRVSPKANVDNGKAIKLANEQDFEQENDTERNDFK